MKEGWICPRCGKVNAPFIGLCDCKPDEMVRNAGCECGCGGKHQWIAISGTSNAYGGGTTFKCAKCGLYKDVWTPANSVNVVWNEF